MPPQKSNSTSIVSLAYSNYVLHKKDAPIINNFKGFLISPSTF